MVYCSNCGTANRDGSRFCNDCGAKLPSGTSVRCPQCGTPNSPSDSFCEKCGNRLVPTLADDAPEPEPSPAVPLKKGLSLPTKPDADASPSSGDWLGQLRSSIDPSTEGEATLSSTTESAADTSQSDWLARLTEYAADNSEPASPEDTLVSHAPAAPQPGAETGEVPDWLTSLGIIDNTPASADEEDAPEWLKQLPLNAAESAADSSSAADSAEPTAPADWLSALRTATPADSAASSDEDVPDWLRSLGTGPLASAQPDQPAAPAGPTQATASTADEDEIPDWLRTLGTGPLSSVPLEPQPAADRVPTDSSPATQPSTSEDMPDWLRGLGAADHTQRSTDELPDWLDSLGTEAAPTQPAGEESSGEDEVPAWLRELGANAETQPVEPVQSADDTSDWMSALRATSQEVEAAEPSTEEPVAEEVPDWLQSMGLPPVEQAPAAADETSDWMSAFRATSQEVAATEPSTEEPAAKEVPDWLQSMGLPPVGQAPAVADETSDWMSALRATSQEEEAAEPSTEEPAAEEVPDWLQSMGLPSAEQAPAAADETSDWMSALRATSQEVEATEPSTEEPVAEEVPDWLRDFNAPPARSGVVEPVEAESGADDVPDWLRDVGPGTVEPAEKSEAGELPDWLQETSATEQEAVGTAESATELPVWLSNLQPSMEATAPVSESAHPEAQPISPEPEFAANRVEAPAFEPAAVAAELPDWLKSLREGKAAAPVQPLEPVPGLTQAEIPSWLEALRPKEGQTTSVADVAAESEQEGIFAGLHNVLPPLPEPGEVPAAARMAAGPSADDLARAGIFQELLSRSVSRPTAVPALPTRGGQAGRRLLQWGVAVALLVVILVPFLMPQGWLPFLPQADNLPAAPLVQSAATTVKVLPPNASVLVVFDYDPAQAGEMDRIAEIMLRHLQTRAAKVTTVSLNPLGAGLASSVWASIGTPPSDHWTDLGYVPGQAVGVQSVLLNHGPFALVIDLSASADGLRWWVEQLTVSGFNMPFIAGVSAAVESLALPYVQSGQITGLISGATGAMMYGRQAELLPSLEEAQQAKAVADRTNQPPSAEVVLMVRNQYHIESQTLAHWLLAALIVIGLVSGLVSRAGRRSTP